MGADDPIGAALFGATRQSVLRLLFGHADTSFYQRQIIRELGVGSGAVQRELAQLHGAGILARTVSGNQTYYQANPECPVFPELLGLVRKTFGIVEVLRAAMNSLASRIDLAFVFGSVAAGKERAGSDLDLMIIGRDLELIEVISSLANAQVQLRREINPTIYGPEEFRKRILRSDQFVTQVLGSEKLFIFGSDGDLGRVGKERLADQAQDFFTGSRRPSGSRR